MANSKIAGHAIAGEKTVAAAGTAEALGTDTTLRYKSITITAKVGNTGQVYVGGSDVDSSTNDGLDSGDTVTFSTPHGFTLAEVFIDVDTNGEGVDFYGVA